MQNCIEKDTNISRAVKIVVKCFMYNIFPISSTVNLGNSFNFKSLKIMLNDRITEMFLTFPIHSPYQV